MFRRNPRQGDGAVGRRHRCHQGARDVTLADPLNAETGPERRHHETYVLVHPRGRRRRGTEIHSTALLSLPRGLPEHLCVQGAVLDGEIACVDDFGRSVYVVFAFELLFLNGEGLVLDRTESRLKPVFWLSDTFGVVLLTERNSSITVAATQPKAIHP